MLKELLNKAMASFDSDHLQMITLYLDGVPVHTVSLQGLLLTKQTQRPQDIQDSAILRRAIEARQPR